MATKRARVCRNRGGAAMRTLPLGPSVELPLGPRTCEGCAKMGRWRHADPPAGAFGGAPYGATRRVRGAPKWGSLRGAGACEHGRWGLRWSSLWGHDPCEGCPQMVSMTSGNSCERGPWGLRWSSLWGHKPCEGCAKMGVYGWRSPHADPPPGAFGGAPYGATNRVRGVPKWGSMISGGACEHGHWGRRWSSLSGREPCEG